MTIREKLKAWVATREVNQTQLAAAAGMASGSVTQYFNGDFELSDIAKVAGIARKLREKHPGATIDWLIDESADWPPPKPDDRVQLTEAEARVIRIIRDGYRDDPELKEVIARLVGRAFAGSGGPTYVASRTAADDRAEQEAATRQRERDRRGGPGSKSGT